MTDVPNSDDTTAIGEQITGMSEMDARRQTIHGYVVTSWRNDTQTAHFVDLNQLKCTCEDYEYTKVGQEICDHLLLANHVSTGVSAEEALNYHLQDRIQTLENVADRLERKATGLVADEEAAAAADSDGDSSDDSDDDDGGKVTEVEPGDDEEAMLEDVEEWLAGCAGAIGFDPAIVDVSWVDTPEGAGAKIEASPFAGGYWDDGDWQDKEGFESEKETLKESVLKARDEIAWYGKPDYENVLHHEYIEEVTG